MLLMLFWVQFSVKVFYIHIYKHKNTHKRTNTHTCSTHPLHQDELCAAHQGGIEPCSLLPEDGDTVLQAALLHGWWDVVLQAVEGLRFLPPGGASGEEETSVGTLGKQLCLI